MVTHSIEANMQEQDIEYSHWDRKNMIHFLVHIFFVDKCINSVS